MSRWLFFIGLFFLLVTFNIQSQDIKTIDEKGLTGLLKNRNSKVLFVNFWATWCVPCREEFPDIVKLAKNFPKVEFVAVSLDHPDEIKSKIEPFLKKMKVLFKNYVAKFKDDQVLIEMINKDWNGAIPATAIYSSNGKQVGFYPKKMSYKEFEKELKNVIK